MPWSRRYFSNDNTDGPVKVWAKVDDNDEVVTENGRVPIRYEDNDDATVYSASPSNVSDDPADHQDDEDNDCLQFLEDKMTRTRRTEEHPPPELEDLEEPPNGQVEIHTDGAASKGSGSKEGPAGLGVVLRSSKGYKGISQYIGRASNQVAELAALYVGLNAVNNRSKPVRVYTDSKYARGMLVNRNWDVNANEQLVYKLRDLGDDFDDLDVQWVEGHSGDPLNERADDLATDAVERHK